MRTIVMGIARGSSPEEFAVDVSVDGVKRSFRLTVVLPGVYSITSDSRDFFDTFRFSMAGKEIARLVIDAYKGKLTALPLDLGDI